MLAQLWFVFFYSHLQPVSPVPPLPVCTLNQVATVRAVRTYHVAHVLLAAAVTGTLDSREAPGTKALEAWALFGRSQERATAAMAQLKGLSGDEAALGVLMAGRDGWLADLEDVVKQAAAYKCVRRVGSGGGGKRT